MKAVKKKWKMKSLDERKLEENKWARERKMITVKGSAGKMKKENRKKKRKWKEILDFFFTVFKAKT